MNQFIFRTTALVVLAILSFSAPSFAGEREGGDAAEGGLGEGGGNAILCTEGNKFYAELLDYAEAKQLRNIKIHLGAASLSVIQKVEFVFRRMAKLDAKLAEAFLKSANEFFSQAQLIPGVDLTPIPDSNHLIMPKNCTLKQLAIRKNPEHPGDKKFFINKDVWDLMNKDQRAGLILHEIVYDHFSWIAKKQGDSSYVRYFNGLISSDSFKRITFKDYVAAIQSIGLNSMEIGSLSIVLDSIKYGADGSLQSAKVDGGEITLKGKAWRVDGSQNVEFHLNGVPKFIRFFFSFNDRENPGLEFSFNGNSVMVDLSKGIGFYSNGEISKATPYDKYYKARPVMKESPLVFQTSLNKLHLALHQNFELHPDGNLKSALAITCPRIEIACKDGSSKIIGSDLCHSPDRSRNQYQLHLDSGGKILNCKDLR